MRDLLTYLLSMVVIVPISKKIGLGSVLGYLIVGALIGPHGLSLLENGADGASQLAEFGVIMMLLLIGLELNPGLLWKMRGPIFGLGSVQMLSTTLVFTLASKLLTEATWPGAITIGMIVSVSSTAVALQSLQELGYSKTVGGERSLAVLLFQDMAVIPILAILPFLAGSQVVDDGSPGRRALAVLAAVVAVIASGRFVIRPAFKLIARIKLREIFTAMALLIVVAAAMLMHEVGMSPALGAFLAGVVLADSEFRHQIEADIEPFKGLLMGLFFITIGASIQLELLTAQPLLILKWVAAILAIKALLVYGIGRAFRVRAPESLLFASALAMGGEFAFVLIAQSTAILDPEFAQILTASIALTMAIAPFLIQFTVKKGMSKLECVKSEERLPDVVDESEKDNPVLVVGIGRFGQTLIRFLRANGIASTVLDIDSEQIDIMARFGIKSYFGDGTNPDLLRAAGLDRARALVLAIDEPESAIKIAEIIRPLYPNLPLFSRAYDRVHSYRLLHLGVTEVAIETSGSALALGGEVLKILGISAERVNARMRLFYVNNQRSIHELSKRYHQDDNETFIQATKQLAQQLDAILKSDPEELQQGATSEWPAERPRSAVQEID